MKINSNFFRQLPSHEKKVTIPTWLTLSRIFLSPIIAFFIIKKLWTIAFWCFIAAALSDTFDGALARLRNEQTILGACLDPIADKILTLTCFFTLACIQTPLLTIPHWFAWLTLMKELLLIIGILLFYFWYGKVTIQPTIVSKLTTMTQLSFIGWLLACHLFCWMPIKTYYVLLGIVMSMIYVSIIQYAAIGLHLRKKI